MTISSLKAKLVLIAVALCACGAPITPNESTLPQLSIDIPMQSLDQLNLQLDLAEEHYTAYRVHPANKGFVPATLSLDGIEYHIEVKIKGGVAHYSREKYSMRVRIQKKRSIWDMSEFSVQDPVARDTMSEWLFQKILQQEDLNFFTCKWVEIEVNGEEQGLFLLEEFVHQNLGGRTDTNHGIFFHFDADSLWAARRTSFESKFENMFATAELQPYENELILQSQELTQIFNLATEKMEAVRRGNLAPDSVLDLNQFARLLAISDLLGDSSLHALQLHNLKFYQPAIGKIEPLGYDFEDVIPLDSTLMSEVVNKRLSGGIEIRPQLAMFALLFSSASFRTSYEEALCELSSKKWLDIFFTCINEELQITLNILRKNYPDYSFETTQQIIYRNAAVIRSILASSNGLCSHQTSIASE